MIDSTTLVTVEEYFAISEKPYFEYLDGVLRQKAMPTYEHSQTELRLSNLINQLAIGLTAGPELTVRLRERRILIPDVGVQRRSELQRPYPTKPIFLCIEILSPKTASATPSPNARNITPGAFRFVGSSIQKTGDAGNITQADDLIRSPRTAV